MSEIFRIAEEIFVISKERLTPLKVKHFLYRYVFRSIFPYHHHKTQNFAHTNLPARSFFSSFSRNRIRLPVEWRKGVTHAHQIFRVSDFPRRHSLIVDYPSTSNKRESFCQLLWFARKAYWQRMMYQSASQISSSLPHPPYPSMKIVWKFISGINTQFNDFSPENSKLSQFSVKRDCGLERKASLAVHGKICLRTLMSCPIKTVPLLTKWNGNLSIEALQISRKISKILFIGFIMKSLIKFLIL